MIPRILSIATPLAAYVTLSALVLGLWHERKKLEWLALAPALAGLLASFFFLPPMHRLFFDEDIYINIASNLSHAPVAQMTLLGSPNAIEVSSYYKEPVGWPLLLSLVFVFTGVSETVGFVVARIFFALAIAAIYQLAREVLETRRQALVAAALFAAAPVCFWFSVSAGTDIPAALFAILGMWGIFSGNGPLAAAGFAMAAQTRLEMIVLIPLVWIPPKVLMKWKLAAAGLVVAEAAHIGWVMSVAPAFARAENVPAVFSLAYVWGNLAANAKYVFDPLLFPTAIALLALVTFLRFAAIYSPPGSGGAGGGHKFLIDFYRKLLPPLTPPKIGGKLIVQALTLFAVYLLFYAGSFNINPRYAIQILAPLVILAASVLKRPVLIAAVFFTAVLPYTQPRSFTDYVQTLAADHRFSVEFARRINPGGLMLSTEHQVFLNQGLRGMNAVFASERKERLDAELKRGMKVWYHSGARTNVVDSEEWRADRWVKSNYELHLIDALEVAGMRIAFYEILIKVIDREARLRPAFERKCDRGKAS